MEEVIGLPQIFDAPLEDLIEYSFQLDGDTLENLYVKVLVSYFQAESKQLATYLDKISELSAEHKHCDEWQLLFKTSKLRWQICTRQVDLGLICELKNLVAKNPLWKGEVYFAIAYAKASLCMHDKAKSAYKKSYISLDKIGAKRKAAMALHNHLAEDYNMHPQKQMFGEWQYLAKKARQAGANAVAGMAYLNLSREYQKISALHSALKYCEKSEEMSGKNTGTIQYFLAVAHRCHVYIEMDRIHEAQILYEELKICQFKEIKSALKVLDKMLGKSESIDQTKSFVLSPSWKNRLKELEQENGKPIKLGKLEDTFLHFISQEPRTKMDIIDHLYGDLLDFDVTENRLKALISRLRKKLPNLIVFKDGHYAISDKIFWEKYKRVS